MASGPSLSLQIGADASGLRQELGQAGQTVRNFGQAAQDTAQNVEANVDAQVRSIASAANYKKELRDCIREVQNLSMAYSQMSDTERNSPLGQALSTQLEQAKSRAAELRDMVDDLNTEIRSYANDTAVFSGVSQGFEVLRDSMSAIIAVSSMAGASTAEFEQAVKDVGQVILTFNALISITNALQKQSALMTTVMTVKNWASERAKRAETQAVAENTVAETANTGATTANTAAKAANAAASGTLAAGTEAATVSTVKLTVAQKALSIVARANPYVLLATVLLSVGSAMYMLFQQSHKATAELKKQQEQAKKTAEAQERLKKKNQELATSSSALKVQFTQLATEYSMLKYKAEKQRWIDENKSRFNALGIEIDGVKMAEDVFVRNTGTVVAAMIARARAMKMIDQAVEDMGDLDKKYADMDKQFVDGSKVSANGKYVRKYKRGMDLSDDEAKRAGVRTRAERTKGISGAGAYAKPEVEDFTDKEIAKINANRQKEARAVQKAVKSRYDAEKKAIEDNVTKAVKAQFEADKKLYSIAGRPAKTPNSTGSTKSTKTEQETPESGSLADLKKQREALAKIQENGTYKKHKTNADAVAKEIQRLDQLISDEQFVIDFNTDPAKVSLETIEKQYDKMYARARNQKLSPEDQAKAAENVKTVNQVGANKRYAVGLDVAPAEDSLVSLQKKADTIFESMRNTEIFGTSQFTELENKYNSVIADVNKKKIELGIDTTAAEGSIDDLQSKIFSLLGQRNALSLEVQTEESKQKIDEIDAKIAELYAQLSGSATELNINTETAHASIKAMEDRISALKQKLNMDVTLGIDDQRDIVSEILKTEADIKQHKITIGLETDPSAEELKKLARETQEALAPKKTSSFEKAVGKQTPAKNDYEGQLRQIQSEMDANDNLIAKLEKVKAKYEEMGKTGEDAYQQITDKIGELNDANDELGKQAKDVDKDDKKAKKRAKNWEYATDAVGSFGDALSSIGSASNTPELNVAGVIAQTLGNLALGASKAIAQASELGPFGWIAFSVTAMAQLASMIAQVNSLTGGYATGGIIPGNSFSGDRLTAKVNSGEMILNSGQ